MNRLIINTANDNLFLVLQTKKGVFGVTSAENVKHNEAMLPFMNNFLKQHELTIKDIDEFGVVVGPGSFTGIRVGISTVKGFKLALKSRVVGINNLDYLYALYKHQNKNARVVAIHGSRDSYFVAEYIHGVLYKYERNLTTKELLNLAKDEKVGMFKLDEEINSELVKDNAEIMLEVFNNSTDETLTPVYYQLSQAENDKLKHGEFKIKIATKKHVDKILEIEENNIFNNRLSVQDILLAVCDKNYKTYLAVFNQEIVGFIIAQITDEINIVSIAVNKEYRNLGLATKLIKKVESLAKKLKLTKLSLEVNYKNITAFKLYEKLNFVIRRERKHYYADGESALEMEKIV